MLAASTPSITDDPASVARVHLDAAHFCESC
jgi:hypothetical protein